MADLRVIINGQSIGLNSLDDQMDDVFIQFYEALARSRSFNMASLDSASQRFFLDHQDPTSHDRYFENFSPIWGTYMGQNQFELAENVWRIALRPVYQWEQANDPLRIHKGTAYYYWGITSILRRDIDRGFLLMHQALVEDRRTHAQQVPSTPAQAFVTLNATVAQQAFRPKVIEISSYLARLLDDYRNQRGRTLTLDEFRTRFLAAPDLQDAVFLFAYVLFRFYALLSEMPSQITQSPFVGQLGVNLLFDLCLIIETVINSRTHAETFGPCVAQLTRAAALPNLHEPLIGHANGAIRQNRENSLTAILNNTFQLSDGTHPSDLEGDILLAYGFRNYGGHLVEPYSFVYQRLSEIFQRIMNALFLSCEVFL